jgi:hypothetical protein
MYDKLASQHQAAADRAASVGGSGTISAARNTAVKAARETIASRIANGDIKPNDFGAMRELAQKMIADVPGLAAQSAESAAEQAVTSFMKGINESVNLSESQVLLLVSKIVERQHKLDEGIMDTIKGAAGSAMNWAQTKGTNLTTKVTADKLLQAWKKAGSPTDSLDVASVIQRSGVPSDTIKQVYTNMKIPVPGTPGSNTATRNIPVDPSSAVPSKPTSYGPQQGQTSYGQVKKLIDQLDATGKKRIIAMLKQSLGLSVAEGSMGTAVSQPPGSTVSAGQRFYKPRHVPNQDEIQKQDELDEACWKGYHKEGNKKMFGKTYPNCVKNEDVAEAEAPLKHHTARVSYHKEGDPHRRYEAIFKTTHNGGKEETEKRAKAAFAAKKKIVYDIVHEQGVAEEQHSCPHCGGEMVSEELMNEKKDACYYKVKSRYKVWPSAYASGALVKCRKKGASNWGNGGKKNESSILEGIERADESLHDWFTKEKWVRMDTKGNIKGPCAREPGEGKPKCLPQSKAHSLGKKGRASAAQRKRREDPNPDRHGAAINVNTKKKS